MSVTSADTIVYNAARISEWQQMDDYDYNRQTVESQTDLLRWLFNELVDLLNELMGQAMDLELTQWLFVVGALVLLVVAGVLCYRLRPAFFGFRREQGLDYQLEEDNIYGVDFDAELSKALARSDYREAVRLKYLQTLKLLTECELIDWQLHKTPTQYTAEFDSEPFRQMTNHFLRVRYGYFDATAQMYGEVAAAYDALAAHHAPREKGGEA